MNVTGLLAWYDESPIWLQASVSAAAKLCDHVLAVDGAYALYPRGKAQSDPTQAEAILYAAYAAGIGCTIHRPREVWTGNQIEKRSALFRLGGELDPDWFYVFDADEIVTFVPADARERLAQATENVAAYTLWSSEGADRYHRGLFRALPGLRVEGTHEHYLAETNGRTLHLRGREDELEPFLNLTDLRVQHRYPQREDSRLKNSAAYDRLVQAHGLEKTTAEARAAV